MNPKVQRFGIKAGSTRGQLDMAKRRFRFGEPRGFLGWELFNLLGMF